MCMCVCVCVLCVGLEGQVMIQSLPSIVAAMALAPSPGDLILDMCAAPGKQLPAHTTH